MAPQCAPQREAHITGSRSQRPVLLLEQMVQVELPIQRRVPKVQGPNSQALLVEDIQLPWTDQQRALPVAKPQVAPAPPCHSTLSAKCQDPENVTDASGARKDFHPYHAQAVPKSENLQASGNQASWPTTMMLRNIPNKYSQHSLMQEINECGFRGTYNFFYLPMDVHNRSNVGYAFINFEAPEDAERFRQQFAEHRFSRYHSHKIATVSVAHVQGLHANLRHFENRAVTQARNDQYRPVVLRGEQKLDFDKALAEASGLGKVAPENSICGTDARRSLEAAIEALLICEQAKLERSLSKGSSGTGTPTSSQALDMTSLSDGTGSDGDLSSQSDTGAEGIDADIADLQRLKLMLGESLAERNRR